tara:strand:+ start:1929 stop:2219 length:291 start_codon:yes stop_codon:yes gene_type:complete
MGNVESTVNSINSKIDKIFEKISQLEIENSSLINELNTLRELNNDKNIELKEKKSELEAIKIANSMLGSNDDKRSSKLKINALIRDINDCIASLTE